MKVYQQLGLDQPIEGEVGIEVEVEGNNLRSMFPRAVPWKAVHDGSLRGESMEYVLRKPLKREAYPLALNVLRNQLEEGGSRVVYSNRCGVHVHINCQELEISDVVSIITTYLCLEEVLVKWCGEDRVGNLFCLRATDAAGIIRYIQRLIDTKNIGICGTDRIRYGSINLKALSTYGSLEFRAMRSDLTPGVIEDWVEMLLRIKDYSVGKQPVDIISQFSMQGPQDFFNDVLGEFRDKVNPCDYDLTTGMRNAQEVAFYAA